MSALRWQLRQWAGLVRWQGVVGLVLAVMTAGAVGADRIGRFGGDAVDIRLRPATVAEMPTSADYAVGNATFDLTLPAAWDR